MRSSATDTQVKATKAWFEDGWVCVRLADEREIRFRAARNRRLQRGTPEQIARVELIRGGSGLHWPELDEDLSVEGILDGRIGE